MAGGVKTVLRPPRRVVFNICPDAVQICIIADDVLVIVPLPQFPVEPRPGASFNPVHIPFRRHGFEPMHDIRQRQRRGNPPWLPDFRSRRGNPPWLPACNGAGTGACPYEDDDGVDVVGHGDECIDIHARIMERDGVPNRVHHATGIIQPHRLVHDLAQQANAVVHAEGDEIRAGLRIIEIPQPNRTATMDGRVKSHATAGKLSRRSR